MVALHRRVARHAAGQALTAEEAAVLEAIGEGLAEEEVLRRIAVLEAQGRKGGDLIGSWKLRFTSSSKFDIGAPLGRRVDGSAPGLEGLFAAASGGEESAAPASSSPVQRTVTSLFPSKQVISAETVETVVELAGLGRLTLVADVESTEVQGRLQFLFVRGFFQFGDLKVPYPVPFELLGDEARGWIDTTYCSEALRVSRGNKGTIFVLTRQRPLDVVVLPGLGNDSGDYAVLMGQLEKAGFSAEVLPVARLDWLRNAVGLLDSNWWSGTLEPRPVLDWYLDRVATLVEQEDVDPAARSPVILLGHSAGGWLARIFLGETDGQGVRRLVTLGTPHCPPLADAEGSFDQTRGLLTFVQERYPELPPSVEGISVMGRYKLGVEDPLEDLNSFIVGLGYKQVHGEAAVWGDGIIPEPSAALSGVEMVLLEGVYHSPLGADETRLWYGDPENFVKWSRFLS